MFYLEWFEKILQVLFLMFTIVIILYLRKFYETFASIYIFFNNFIKWSHNTHWREFEPLISN